MQLALLLTLVGSMLQDTFLLAVALGVLGLVLVAWVWNRFSLSGLMYTRRFEMPKSALGPTGEARAFLGETVTLVLEMRNRKMLPLTWLEAMDRVPGTLQLEGAKVVVDPLTHLGEIRTFWRLGALKNAVRRFTIPCDRRGYHFYGPVRLTTGDGFGLFKRTRQLDGSQQLIVYPRVYSAADLRLPAKHPFGERTAKRQIFEDPLRTAGVREWDPADGMRHIHWLATARHQRLLSRRYEPSQEPHVLIALNMATLPRHWEGVILEMLERAVSVAASLALLCSEMRQPIGLLTNGYWPNSDQLLRLMPGRNPDQLMHIMEMLAAVTGFANRPLEELLLHEAPRIPWGSTVLVVSPIAHAALLRALMTLRKQKQQVALFTLAEEPPGEVLPGIVVYHLPHLVEDLIVPARI